VFKKLQISKTLEDLSFFDDKRCLILKKFHDLILRRLEFEKLSSKEENENFLFKKRNM
jgi:hypothetical protein